MMIWGIQLKGLIIGLLLAYFAIPWISRTMINRTARPAT
jgi:antibiotic biosynthesis monooxygenase (ABM) superfamily enzyme